MELAIRTPPDDADKSKIKWSLDIDFDAYKHQAKQLEDTTAETDARCQLVAYIAYGTIPYMRDKGIPWASMLVGGTDAQLVLPMLRQYLQDEVSTNVQPILFDKEGQGIVLSFMDMSTTKQ